MAKLNKEDRFKGAAIGAIMGDAYGYPLEDMSYEEICERFEKKGALRIPINKETQSALFSADTQQMLFTEEALLWGDSLLGNAEEVNFTTYVFYGCQQWLYTQLGSLPDSDYGWILNKRQSKYRSTLLKTKSMFEARNPDEETLYALQRATKMKYGKLIKRYNSFNGNGALSRIIPIALYFNNDCEEVFRMSAEAAAITHGNMEAIFAAGLYGVIIAEIINGKTPEDAIKRALEILDDYDDYEGQSEVKESINEVIELLDSEDIAPLEAVAQLGDGTTALSALSIGLYCAVLHQNSIQHAVQLAVNQDGASSECGMVCGAVIGAYYGFKMLPKKWTAHIQNRKIIDRLNASLYEASKFNEPDDEQLNSVDNDDADDGDNKDDKDEKDE